jgi:hypothetical protein
MKKPENMTDEELSARAAEVAAEAERRRVAKAMTRAVEHHARIQALVDTGNGCGPGGKSALDIVVPDHTPPRYEDDLCTDADLNGVYRRQDDLKEYPCTRCRALYAALYTVEQLRDHPVTIELEVNL